MNFKPKTLLLATLCAAAVLLSCKKDETVDTQVVADFTFTQGTAGAVTFKNTSKNATGYAWDFGDGEKATEENPTHTYTKDGTYTVKLTATNKDGSADKTATVTVDNIVTSAPITIAIADLSQLVILEKSPKGTLIGEIAATVANSDETPVYSITSQSLAGAIALEGKKMVIADASAFDYDTNKELTGEIQATVGGVTTTAAFTVLVDKLISVPDDEFKGLLKRTKGVDANGDGEISLLEAQAYTGAIEGGIGITDASEIEYFTNLSVLDLGFNQLSAIDVSQNTALTELSLDDNELTAIDVSQNTALTALDLQSNELTALDVSKNTALTELILSDNELTAIDVSQNFALTQLYLQNSAKLTKVNLANGNNDKLTDLNLSANPNLTCVQVDKIPSPFPTGWRFDNASVLQTDACP